MIIQKPLLPLLLLAGLSACGDGGSAAAGDATPSAAATSVAANAPAVVCEGLPPHAILTEDARISLCTQGETRPGHVSGTVIYQTAKGSADVLAWYRAKAGELHLTPGVDTPSSTSATEGTRRSFMAMVAPVEGGSGTQVTLNWGMDK